MRNNHNNHHYQRNNQRPSHQGGGRRAQGKRLDYRLFINKAVVDESAMVEPQQTTTTFKDFAFDPIIHQNIEKRGYTTPSPIQEASIPHILQGKDVIGVANTGTGKTAAFLLPVIHKLFLNRENRALIVTPTRELALQIVDEFRLFSAGMNISVSLCIGGTPMFRQENQLRQRPQLIIGTPGRLKDLANRRKLNLTEFTTVVLDEVDRMVDIGFIQDIRYLIGFLPKQRQSLFFTATITDSVKGILQQFVTNPITVSVKKHNTSVNVDQDIIKVSGADDKLYKLQDLLRQEDFKKVLVFGRTKHGVERVSKKLMLNGFKVAAIHGNKSQGQRQRALDQFKSNAIQVLLATDVASRGLDIENVTHVINFDVPESYDDYVHRIGRTGRANNKGTALTFVE